jgi:hypothetical protein
MPAPLVQGLFSGVVPARSPNRSSIKSARWDAKDKKNVNLALAVCFKNYKTGS